MSLRFILLICVGALILACGENSTIGQSGGVEKVHRPELPTTTVTLPDGTPIEAELAITQEEQGRGMMFREYLPDDKGMLFVGSDSQPRRYWMYQCLIPLDLLWLDGNHLIVEINPDVPPCAEADARKCPTFGGTVNSVYVLELAAGQAAAHGLKLGDRIDF